MGKGKARARRGDEDEEEDSSEEEEGQDSRNRGEGIAQGAVGEDDGLEGQEDASGVESDLDEIEDDLLGMLDDEEDGEGLAMGVDAGPSASAHGGIESVQVDDEMLGEEELEDGGEKLFATLGELDLSQVILIMPTRPRLMLIASFWNGRLVLSSDLPSLPTDNALRPVHYSHRLPNPRHRPRGGSYRSLIHRSLCLLFSSDPVRVDD
jgi:hypothetical protein